MPRGEDFRREGTRGISSQRHRALMRVPVFWCSVMVNSLIKQWNTEA